jgi:hypothetical protein
VEAVLLNICSAFRNEREVLVGSDLRFVLRRTRIQSARLWLCACVRSMGFSLEGHVVLKTEGNDDSKSNEKEKSREVRGLVWQK